MCEISGAELCFRQVRENVPESSGPPILCEPLSAQTNGFVRDPLRRTVGPHTCEQQPEARQNVTLLVTKQHTLSTGV
jgi:hypothetical protein